MLKKPIVILLVLMFLLPPYANVAGSNKCVKLESEVGQVISEIIQEEVRIKEICPSSINGVYEVVINDGKIVYVDPQSKTIILGVLTQDGKNLTKKRQIELGFLIEPDEVIPPAGVTLPVKWGDLGKQMIEAGVIDPQKVDALYSKRGGLSEEDKRLLYAADNGNLKITVQNSGFFLNMLWALGLGNKNDILNKGPMNNPPYKDPGRFASTGGWTLAKGDAMQHYSKHLLIELDREQQEILERVSNSIYRPCCNNPTHFPDCNHGMAMLGLLELIASQGLSEEEVYRVALQVNSYWFPDTYLTVAQFFKKQGVEWQDVDPQEILGLENSSGTGYRKILAKVKPFRRGGGGCGV
jgi:hypothetical protein